MMQTAKPALGAVFLLALAAMSAGAHATSLDLAGGCAVAGSGTLHEAGSSFEAGRLEVVVPGLGGSPPPSLHAARLHGSAEGGTLGAGALEQAATAAAAGLLTALAGHQEGGCPDRVMREAAAPLAHLLQAGGRAAFVWTDVSVRAGSTRFGARHLSLRADGGGAAAHLTFVLDGAISNDPAAALLPEALAVKAALPASELPALFSAAGGHGEPVDVTIEQADARRGNSTLSGHGQASIASSPGGSSGQGHVTAHGFDALLDAAAGNNRIRTALFLARLVAHRQGDQADWDLAWQSGTLLVNNVPLPLQ